MRQNTSWVRRALWRIVSIPIFFKILGIGALVAVLFGGIALLETRESMGRVLTQLLEQRTQLVARAISDSIERPMSTDDRYSVQETVRRSRQSVPDVQYVFALTAEGEVVAHTFARAVPLDLLRLAREGSPSADGLQMLGSEQGMILDAQLPILDGRAGSLHVGMGDAAIAGELSAWTRSIYRSLAISVALGILLAIILTNLLAKPIHHLEQAANSIRAGAFDARARIFSFDEIGHLAVSFNQMAESLQSYQREVEEKEQARAALIEHVVRTLEEERKSVSRELHDHFGQSLLAVLLAIQSDCDFSSNCGSACAQIEQKLRELVDDVHRLAWGMRPSILDDYGLDHALSRHVEETASHLGIEIDYHSTLGLGQARLPESVELTLFRVVQEATTNIARHSGASRASVVFLRTRDAYVLIVEDDGRGFEVTTARNNRCLGLIGLRERVGLLGGTVDIESAPDRGTTIRVRIPSSQEP